MELKHNLNRTTLAERVLVPGIVKDATCQNIIPAVRMRWNMLSESECYFAA